jgi:pimeloyl-ACP methyl ester carboxylesterase
MSDQETGGRRAYDRQAKQVHNGFVQTNGTQLCYEMAGSGHPLVLLHGGYMDRRMWDDQFAAFAQDHGVIRYDIRGFGKSALPQVPYADREDLCDLLTFLGIEKTYLLGFSLGGGIALDFTLEHPEQVDALILVGSPVNGARPRDVLIEEEEQALRIEQQPFDEAKSRRNIPDMVEALMNHPTLVPSPEYASARSQVRKHLSEYSFVWVLDPAPQQPLDPPAWEGSTKLRFQHCFSSARRMTSHSIASPTNSNKRSAEPGESGLREHIT